MIFSRSLAVLAIAPMLALGAAGGSSASAQTVSRTAHTAHVAIHAFAFGPKRLVITAGTKVVWTNKDPANHTVTGDSGNPARFDSPTMGQGRTFSFTFEKAGTYKYHCAFHQFMHGTIIVRKKG